jgi:hypothetical protein
MYLQRMRKDQPMTTISIRIPEDVIDDLKEIAPSLGFSGYEPLIRAYLGGGLRRMKPVWAIRRSRYSLKASDNGAYPDQVISAAIAESATHYRLNVYQMTRASA